MTAIALSPIAELSAADRCDQCGDQALVAVHFAKHDVELLFCAEHFTGRQQVILDEGGRLVADARAVH